MFGAKAATKRFAGQVSHKTGLVQQGDRFAGTFEGLPAWCQTQVWLELLDTAFRITIRTLPSTARVV